MGKRIWIVIIALIMGLGLASAPETAIAISPQQLQEMMDRGEPVTIIDIRVLDLYRDGHIPGAISMPVTIISKKQVPPVGTVVVYGDGIRTDLDAEALRALNARPGIQASILEGGFSAWETLNLPTTHKSGFREERLPYLSYQELEKVAEANPDIVLVDLRTVPDQANTSDTLTDLSTMFPGLNSVRLLRKPQSDGKEWDISTVTQRGGKDTYYRWLYILIDNGDGEAEKVARTLKAAGIKRMAILTGGEQILRRGGSPGLETIKTREK